MKKERDVVIEDAVLLTYECPKCKSADLRVAVTTVARLSQDSDGNVDCSDIQGDIEFDESSTMLCNACDFTATAKEFRTEEH